MPRSLAESASHASTRRWPKSGYVAPSRAKPRQYGTVPVVHGNMSRDITRTWLLHANPHHTIRRGGEHYLQAVPRHAVQGRLDAVDLAGAEDPLHTTTPSLDEASQEEDVRDLGVVWL